MERKIIGYKLVKEQYKKAASMIAFGNRAFLADFIKDFSK